MEWKERPIIAANAGAGPSKPALASVRVEVDDPVRRLAGGALVTLPALRTDWPTRVCGFLGLRALNTTDQTVQVAERLVEPATKVLELANSVSTIGE